MNRRWYGSGGPILWLLPLSWIFALVVRLRRVLYRMRLLPSVTLGVPVVVVGNLVAGGSGKTPVVIALAQALRDAGQVPGIVSRGYGARVPGIRILHAEDSADAVGDEAALLARNGAAVVAIGADRVEVARTLKAAQPVTVILTDDGLQHYRLRRDCEICVVDGRRAFGNGALLPAGPLREPVSRLVSTDIVLRSGKPGPGEFGFRLEPGEAYLLSDPTQRRPLSGFKGERVHAVAGIGDPRRFFDMLAQLGIFVKPHPFPDHHRYREEELHFGDDLPVFMTEKDAVKCVSFDLSGCWVVPVRAVLDPGMVATVKAIVEAARK